MWAKKLPVIDDVSSIIINGQFKKFNSAARFRSEDIRVMSPARFHCATALLNHVSLARTEQIHQNIYIQFAPLTLPRCRL